VRPNNLIYRFGAWGMCQTAGQDKCSPRSFGYDLPGMLTQIAANGSVTFHSSLRNATKANILVPIACGITFLAMLIAWTSNKFGFFFASFISIFAFIVSLAAMVANFAIYGMAKNDAHSAGLKADYGSAMWMLLGATIALLLAALTSLFQCCCGGRRHRDRGVHTHHEAGIMRETRPRRGLFGRRVKA